MNDKQYYIDEWNKEDRYITKESNYNYDIRNKHMINYCEKLLLKAKQAYYSGNDIMCDETFDMLENRLKILNPKSHVLKKVG